MTCLPSKTTLTKYGMSLHDWLIIMEAQSGVCPICGNYMKRPVIDHEHVAGWKKMPPEERKKYVRGVTDWLCNHRVLTRGMNVQRAKNLVMYLENYQQKSKR